MIKKIKKSHINPSKNNKNPTVLGKNGRNSAGYKVRRRSLARVVSLSLIPALARARGEAASCCCSPRRRKGGSPAEEMPPRASLSLSHPRAAVIISGAIFPSASARARLGEKGPMRRWASGIDPRRRPGDARSIRRPAAAAAASPARSRIY